MASKEIKQMNGKLDDFSKKSLEARFLKNTPWVINGYKTTEEYGVTNVTFHIGLSKFKFLFSVLDIFPAEMTTAVVKEVQCYYFDTVTGDILDKKTAKELKEKRGKPKCDLVEHDSLEEERKKDEDELINVVGAIKAGLCRILEEEKRVKASREQKILELEQEYEQRMNNFIKSDEERKAEALRKKEVRQTMINRCNEIIHNSNPSQSENKEEETSNKRISIAIEGYRTELDVIFDSLIKVIEEFISMKSYERANEAIDFLESRFPDKKEIIHDLRNKIKDN